MRHRAGRAGRVFPRDLSVPSTRMEKWDGETDKASESLERSEKVSLHAAPSVVGEACEQEHVSG